jgi:hypothetical protein
LDSTAKEEAGIQLQTISYDANWKGFELSTELGRGQLYSAVQKCKAGEMPFVREEKHLQKLPRFLLM